MPITKLELSPQYATIFADIIALSEEKNVENLISYMNNYKIFSADFANGTETPVVILAKNGRHDVVEFLLMGPFYVDPKNAAKGYILGGYTEKANELLATYAAYPQIQEKMREAMAIGFILRNEDEKAREVSQSDFTGDEASHNTWLARMKLKYYLSQKKLKEAFELFNSSVFRAQCCLPAAYENTLKDYGDIAKEFSIAGFDVSDIVEQELEKKRRGQANYFTEAVFGKINGLLAGGWCEDMSLIVATITWVMPFKTEEEKVKKKTRLIEVQPHVVPKEEFKNRLSMIIKELAVQFNTYTINFLLDNSHPGYQPLVVKYVTDYYSSALNQHLRLWIPETDLAEDAQEKDAEDSDVIGFVASVVKVSASPWNYQELMLNQLDRIVATISNFEVMRAMFAQYREADRVHRSAQAIAQTLKTASAAAEDESVIVPTGLNISSTHFQPSTQKEVSGNRLKLTV